MSNEVAAYMSIKKEYLRQADFRNWEKYLVELPFNNNSIILDLGCGPGTVTNLLGQKYSTVIGIDSNEELIAEAISSSSAENISFLHADISNINDLRIPAADGIWCSFTAAYFPDLDAVIPNWITLLKTGGWLALIEVNDLFHHSPLTKESREAFEDHYQRLLDARQYDFMMGSKLTAFAKKYRLEVAKSFEMNDLELNFDGPATDKVLAAWHDRFNRMSGFRLALGDQRFNNVTSDFLACLQRQDHTCSAKVNFLIALKNF